VGKRIKNLKRIAANKGWLYVVMMLTFGWILAIWILIGCALRELGIQMIKIGNKL